MFSDRPVTILLVEDDLGHARLIEKNLRRANITNEIVHISDGKSASDYIFREGCHVDSRRPVPLLILLDLDLPVINGFQILERIKSNPRTKHIAVVVLTGTDDQQEIDRCYALGCNVFITKPVDYLKFMQSIQRLGLFITVVKLAEKE